MKEWWSTRWYTPLVALGVAALELAVVALAIVEVLVAAAPTGPTGSSAPFAPQNRSAVAEQWISFAREAGHRPFPGGQS